MTRWIPATLAAAFLVSACRDGATPVAPGGPRADLAGGRAQLVPGQYVVVLKPDVQDVVGTASALVAAHGGTLLFTYQYALKGFAAQLPDQAAAALVQHPLVAGVYQDQEVHTLFPQSNPDWGLDRVDQVDLPLSGTYDYGATGNTVRVYIIDTGIRQSHVDFGGRAIPGQDEIGDGFGTNDCFGHGTHVSGTSGGYTYGMAKGVVLVAVRVLNCFGSGTDAQVIAGIDYVTAQKNANPTVPSVANMSLGGGFFQPLNTAVENSIAAGVVYAVAAGNSGAPDACNTSPASAPDALTVGATDINDNMASFSSFGPCVDIFAPGVNTTSDWNNGDQSTNTISGTSMATPHVAGAAALYLETTPGATPAQVHDALIGNATPNRINGIPAGSGTVNLLLYTGFIATGSPVPAPPVASFTYMCPKQGGGRTCTFSGSATGAPGSPFTWDFGDGTTGTGMTVTHSYSRRGTYQVKLTVQGGEGQTNTRLKSVTTGTSG